MIYDYHFNFNLAGREKRTGFISLTAVLVCAMRAQVRLGMLEGSQIPTADETSPKPVRHRRRALVSCPAYRRHSCHFASR